MSITKWTWRKKKMNATDKVEIANPTCPYCNGRIVNGKCEGCGWEEWMEYPPMEEE